MRALGAIALLAAPGLIAPAFGESAAPDEEALRELWETPLETVKLTTPDGATIALSRRPPLDGENPGEPVLLVHGINSNHRCWDTTPEASLAAQLQLAGFDPWMLDLRGHGHAELGSDGELQLGDVEDYSQLDLPTALDHILKQRDVERLNYVGHSMGGIVGFAHGITAEEELIDRLVILGSPLDFSDPDPIVASALSLTLTSANIFGKIDSPFFATLYARLGFTSQVDRFRYNDIENPSMAQAEAVSPLNPKELSQFATVAGGALTAPSRSKPYCEELAAITTPTLVIAGRADLVAPVDRVWCAYSGLSSEEREFIIAGERTGFSVDYGHQDLVYGDRVGEEINPIVIEWLSR